MCSINRSCSTATQRLCTRAGETYQTYCTTGATRMFVLERHNGDALLPILPEELICLPRKAFGACFIIYFFDILLLK